jgi:hypothetical protein
LQAVESLLHQTGNELFETASDWRYRFASNGFTGMVVDKLGLKCGVLIGCRFYKPVYFIEI